MLYVVIAVIAIGAVFMIWRQLQAGGGTAAMERIRPQQYQADFVQSGAAHLLVDVRTPEEFNSGYIPGAVNIPLQSLQQRMSEIPQDQPVVLYCRSGNRSATAAQMLARAGYEEVYDLGGIIDWQSQGLPVQ